MKVRPQGHSFACRVACIALREQSAIFDYLAVQSKFSWNVFQNNVKEYISKNLAKFVPSFIVDALICHWPYIISQLKCKASSLWENSFVLMKSTGSLPSYLECYTNLPFCLLLIVGFCTVNVEKRLMFWLQEKRSVREDYENVTCGV